MSLVQLIVGGSSGLGKALAYEYAEKKFNVILVARDARDLDAISKDLRIKFGVSAFFIETNIAESNFDENVLYQQVLDILHIHKLNLHSIDLVAGGAFPGDNDFPLKETLESNTQLNFWGPARIATCFLRNYAHLNFKKILFVSSIACIRPRPANVSYTATKIALESFATSLRQSVYQQQMPLHIQILRLGYMESRFTFGKKLLFPVAQPENVARFLVSNLSKDMGVFYYPHFWRLISLIIRALPWRIYRVLKF